MDMDSREEFLYQQNQQTQTNKRNEQIRKCSHCGAVLEEDDVFCPECGEKIGGQERICPVCKTSTTTEYCPHCGYKIIPTICPKCGKEGHNDFCENCGTILNKRLEEHLKRSEQKEESSKITQEHIEAIDRKFENSKTAELAAFLKKVKEHQILLEEREYFNKREKRIVNVFGKGPIEFELPDPEEQAFMMKAYANLEKVVIERQNKAMKEELERLFPDVYLKPEVRKPTDEEIKAEEERRQKEQAEKAEIESQRQEMERRYQKAMNEISDELKIAQDKEKARLEAIRKKEEEERKRREEEERLRRLEQERIRKIEEERRKKEEEKRRAEQIRIEREEEARRAEQEAKERLILGTYVYNDSERDEYLSLDSIYGSSVFGCVKDEYSSGGYSEEEIKGRKTGNSLELRVLSRNVHLPPNHKFNEYHSFNGTFNSDFTRLEGYWVSDWRIINITYYKY